MYENPNSGIILCKSSNQWSQQFMTCVWISTVPSLHIFLFLGNSLLSTIMFSAGLTTYLVSTKCAEKYTSPLLLPPASSVIFNSCCCLFGRHLYLILFTSHLLFSCIFSWGFFHSIEDAQQYSGNVFPLSYLNALSLLNSSWNFLGPCMCVVKKCKFFERKVKYSAF